MQFVAVTLLPLVAGAALSHLLLHRLRRRFPSRSPGVLRGALAVLPLVAAWLSIPGLRRTAPWDAVGIALLLPVGVLAGAELNDRFQPSPRVARRLHGSMVGLGLPTAGEPQ